MNKKSRMVLFLRKCKYVLGTHVKCYECGGKILYFCKYDTYFCLRCNVWFIKNRDDPYRSDRPESPEIALAYYNFNKERAIRHYSANERYKKRLARCSSFIHRNKY